MGGSVSADRDNNELVEKLFQAKYLKTNRVYRVFRSVDRADYILPSEKKDAYKDLAWKNGLLHLSSPCIYCDVMEGLKLKPGLSFLNLGSGTGYLNTMAGLILGTRGVNHGIELHTEVVEYAHEKLQSFMMNSAAMDEFDFCEPKFVVGNCLNLSLPDQQYDRVYCGAACPEEYEHFIKNLIKVGGILVMPLEDSLLWIKRTSHSDWTTKKLHCVSFSRLVSPGLNKNTPITMPEIVPASLQVLCRTAIRKILRDNIMKEQPQVNETLTKAAMFKSKKRLPYSRVNTLCLAIDEENSDSDEEDFNRLHNLDSESGAREVNALLRLVLSMGGARGDRSHLMYDDHSMDRESLSDDEEVTSSDSEVSHMSTLSDDENKEMEAESVAENEEFNVLSSSSKSRDKKLDAKLEDLSEESKLKDSSDESKSKDSSDESKLKDSSDESELSKPSSSKSNSDVNSKSKVFDSGIVADNSWETCSSQCETSDQADLNSSIDNVSDNSPKASKKENKSSTESCRRKRHITGEQDCNCDGGESSDSDSDENVVTRSKQKKSAPTPHPYDVNRKLLSEGLMKKIQNLPLPPALKEFLNMNRKFCT